MIKCICCVKPIRTNDFPYNLFFWRSKACEYTLVYSEEDETGFKEINTVLTYMCEPCWFYAINNKSVTEAIINARIASAAKADQD